MVRPVLTLAATLGLTVLAAESAAQSQTHEPAADWSRAGGALFPSDPARTLEDAPAVLPDLPPLEAPSPAQPYGSAVAAAAGRHGLDPKLLHALVAVESAYRPDVCSSAGACGLTQLMPATARELGVADRFAPEANLEGGADYLARQLRRFGDVGLALAAYNSGPERVARLGRIPEIAETRDYVRRVVDCYLALTAGRTVRGVRDCEARGGRP